MKQVKISLQTTYRINFVTQSCVSLQQAQQLAVDNNQQKIIQKMSQSFHNSFSQDDSNFFDTSSEIITGLGMETVLPNQGFVSDCEQEIDIELRTIKERDQMFDAFAIVLRRAKDDDLRRQFEDYLRKTLLLKMANCKNQKIYNIDPTFMEESESKDLQSNNHPVSLYSAILANKEQIHKLQTNSADLEEQLQDLEYKQKKIEKIIQITKKKLSKQIKGIEGMSVADINELIRKEEEEIQKMENKIKDERKKIALPILSTNQDEEQREVLQNSEVYSLLKEYISKNKEITDLNNLPQFPKNYAQITSKITAEIHALDQQISSLKQQKRQRINKCELIQKHLEELKRAKKAKEEARNNGRQENFENPQRKLELESTSTLDEVVVNTYKLEKKRQETQRNQLANNVHRGQSSSSVNGAGSKPQMIYVQRKQVGWIQKIFPFITSYSQMINIGLIIGVVFLVALFINLHVIEKSQVVPVEDIGKVLINDESIQNDCKSAHMINSQINCRNRTNGTLTGEENVWGNERL